MMLNSRNIFEKDKFHGIAKTSWSADVSECYYHMGQPSERSMVVPQRSSQSHKSFEVRPECLCLRGLWSCFCLVE